MKYASVCSGVEAATLAWDYIGWEPAWFSEIDKFPAAVLAHRFPNVPNLGDMTKIKCLDNTKGIFEYDTTNGTVRSEFGRIDLLVGGTPCQSFSVAGNQQGLRGVSGLALTYVELLRAMRPTWFVWENVPGVFSTNGGRDFETLIRAFDEVGYSLAWRVLDVQYCRVDGFPRAIPQRRRRVFVVGHSSGDARYPAEVLFEPSCLRGTTPPRRVKGKGFTAGVGSGTESASAIRMRAGCEGGGKGALVGNELSHTLGTINDQTIAYCRGGDDTNAATMVKVCPTQLNYNGGKPIVFPVNSMILGKKLVEGDRQGVGIGNADDPAPTLGTSHSHAVVCINDQGGNVIHIEDENISPTLRSETKHHEHLIAEGLDLESVSVTGACARTLTAARSDPQHQPCVMTYENHANDSRIREDDTPCLTARCGTGGGNLPLVQEPIMYDNQTRARNPKECKGVACTLGACMGTTGNTTPLVKETTASAIAIATHSSVRRITPIEAERLMGFPDNWTQIPWRGKPAEECPDGPRYKC